MAVRRIVAVLVGACGLALALPGVAPARTKVVTMGLPPGTGQSFERLQSDVNDYFPHAVRIRVGDAVRFVPTGFHDVDLPPHGGPALPLVVPTPQLATGVLDAAGLPFWFNGLPLLAFNPVLATSNFGKRLGFDGGTRVTSGLPLGQGLKPMTVRFTRTGSYRYYCNIHQGMFGRVTVVGRRRAVPSALRDRRRAQAQVARALRIAGRLSRAKVPAGVVDVGEGGRHGVEHLGFVPATRTVPVGTTLRFRMSPRSVDVHTATAGPGDPERQPQSYLGRLAAGLTTPVFDARASYPSQLPGTTGTLTPALHGNGFWNTGVLDNSGSTPLPAEGSVTFGAPGTYALYCLIHPFMKATVVVR